MNRLPLCQFAIAVVFCLALCGTNTWAAENSDDLEQRVKQLEQQLTELKTLLEEQKAQEKEEAAKPVVPEPQPGQATLLGKGTLKVGGDIRWRGLMFDNVWNYDSAADWDQREVFRFRPRVYLDWMPTPLMEAYVRFTKEWFYGQDNEHFGYDVEAKDAMFDNAWAEMKDMFGTGLNLRVGRQDLIYGEGFVLLDGTPYDGSQTISFDAAKLTWNHNLGSSDLLYAKLHEATSFQFADDEDLYGLYNKLKIDSIGLGLEPYVLVRNKNDAPDLSGAPGDKAPFNPYDPSPKEQTYLLGLRGTYSFDIADDVKLSLVAEGGKEWGEVDFNGVPTYASSQSTGFVHNGVLDADRDAWGGYFHSTLAFNNMPWKPALKTGINYMSGDDPNTADYEGWDDFYGQWPKYSELYIYTLYDGFKFATGSNDPDLGAWSNMIIPEVMLTVKPTDRWTQSLRYLYFMAEESTGPGGGDERGHNLQWLTNYVFTENLSGHFLAEWFAPGDYYAAGADDAYFVRFQLLYTF